MHPCNLYEFALYGGLTPQARYMEPLLQGALKNDTQKEMFDLPIDAGAGATGRGKGVVSADRGRASLFRAVADGA